MPVNLNALIRYKTIDECLINKYLDCTIDVLVVKCSDKLAEFQGSDSSISERTIRNDIRVLRSDTLGFNAPIIINKGIYSYDNSYFTLFGRPIKELDILQDIQDLLLDEFDNIKNDNISNLLLALSGITNKKLPHKFYQKSQDISFIKFSNNESKIIEDPYKQELINYVNYLNASKRDSFLKKLLGFRNVEFFSWKFIFEILNSSSDL